MIYRFALSASGVMVNDRGGPYVKYEHYQKLEAELESLRQQVTVPADDGWTEWTGGECPVDGTTVVGVKFVDGYQNEYEACVLEWGHSNDHADIIAYRTVKP
jgi:hypothetical protein